MTPPKTKDRTQIQFFCPLVGLKKALIFSCFHMINRRHVPQLIMKGRIHQIMAYLTSYLFNSVCCRERRKPRAQIPFLTHASTYICSGFCLKTSYELQDGHRCALTGRKLDPFTSLVWPNCKANSFSSPIYISEFPV